MRDVLHTRGPVKALARQQGSAQFTGRRPGTFSYTNLNSVSIEFQFMEPIIALWRGSGLLRQLRFNEAGKGLPGKRLQLRGFSGRAFLRNRLLFAAVVLRSPCAVEGRAFIRRGSATPNMVA